MAPGMEDFAGKVAVVTGGGTGIGRATALRMANGGGSVVIGGRRAAPLGEVAAAAKAQGLAISAEPADVTRAGEVERLIAAAVERYGGLDILVCAAGVQSYGTVPDVSEEEWKAVVATNLTGAFLAAKYAVPAMRKRGGGTIVFVSSQHAYATAPGRAAYAASKAALLGLTRAMALDHGPEGIRVNVVCPGAIDTPMLREAWPRMEPDRPVEDLFAELASLHPVKRVGRAEEVAEMIAHLAGPCAGFTTGSDFRIEGGVLSRLSIAPRR